MLAAHRADVSFGNVSVVPASETPPTTPTDLTATPVSESQIDLTWSAAADPESGVVSYRVYRNGVKVSEATHTRFSDTGLFSGTTCTYEVSAVNGVGLEGPKSTPATATTLSDTIPPIMESITANSDPNQVIVVFSESVVQTSAETASNYTIDNGVVVSAAALLTDQKSVALTASTLSEGIPYTLSVSSVQDLAGNPIAPNSQKAFTFTETYQVDGNTIALYHFDGDLSDSSPNGLRLTAAGNARWVSDNTGWMTNPRGQALRTTDLGDQVTVSIPDGLVLAGNKASPITLEARFYPRAYKAYGVGDYPILSLNQSWDTSLEVLDGKWNNPPVPSVRSGTQTIVSADTWAKDVASGVWHLLRITFDVDGRVKCYVDKNLLGSQVVSMNFGRTNDWVLTLGNFDGDIDEVRISNVVRAGPSGGSAPAAKPAVSTVLDEEAEAEGASKALAFGLEQNYPNPFNPSTAVRYRLPEASEVRLTIYNVLGQQVRVLVNGPQRPGVHSVQWDGRDALGRGVATGLYLYRLEAAGRVAVQKMTLAK